MILVLMTFTIILHVKKCVLNRVSKNKQDYIGKEG